ncbi:hypothetical protein F0562_006466 [Nyssa sinensis]|uniref:Integrase catalytic domain-containing protein n=1 Tax=Nyssa sinensis TaxID=561372 RepID=A0A5J5AR10_9ASTE|nr:hypothetical protein F0562_006466 [Nyssa sinensis]
MEMGESAMLAMQGKNKPQANKKGKGKEKLAPQADIKKDPVCFFYKKKGHVKKDCPKFQKWLEKKGNQLSLVCYESNMVDVVYNSWWIDSGSTIHISNSLQDTSFSLIYESEIVGVGTMCDGLFCINLQNDATYNAMHVHTGIKRCVVNEDSSTLWHRRLGHISIERIKRLVNDGVLSTHDFTDFETCVDCIKGKQTNKSTKGAIRSSHILEIIHTDICSPDMDSHGQKYFISFIDDYSRYMYLYLLHNKNEALDAFKVFKAEVEKQCGKQIKIVRSDRGVEFYGRYTEDGQAHGPFARIVESKNAKFLENDLISGRDHSRNTFSENDHSDNQPSISSNRLIVVHNTPSVQIGVEQPIIEVPQVADNIQVGQGVQELPIPEQPVEPHLPQEDIGAALRRSTRTKKSAIPSDYVVYLQETDYDIEIEDCPESFS